MLSTIVKSLDHLFFVKARLIIKLAQYVCCFFFTENTVMFVKSTSVLDSLYVQQQLIALIFCTFLLFPFYVLDVLELPKTATGTGSNEAVKTSLEVTDFTANNGVFHQVNSLIF